MVAPEVDQKLLEELEGMGFPKARATWALRYSGKSITTLIFPPHWNLEVDGCSGKNVWLLWKKCVFYTYVCVFMGLFILILSVLKANSEQSTMP